MAFALAPRNIPRAALALSCLTLGLYLGGASGVPEANSESQLGRTYQLIARTGGGASQSTDGRHELSKAGSVKRLPADYGPEALRIIRGTVSWDGTVWRGSGFTSTRNSTGRYTITFNTPFAGTPPQWPPCLPMLG